MEPCQFPQQNSYKYLGQLREKKGSMKLDIQSKKQSSEANTRNIMCLAKDSVMNRVKITVMYQKCVVPALIHTAETWQNYQDYSKQMEEINYNNIRRILKVPSSTLLPTLLMETGIFNLEQLVHQKKLGFYHRINNMEENRLIKQVFRDQK